MTRFSIAIVTALVAFGCGSRPAFDTPYSMRGVELTVKVIPSPPKAGEIEFEFTLARDGKPDERTRVDARVSGATSRGAAVDVRIVPSGPGLYRGYAAVAPGSWELEVELLIDSEISKVSYRMQVQ